MRFAKHNAILYGGITAVSVLFIVLIGSLKSPEASALAAVMLLLFLAPIALFYLYRIFMIYHHINDYTFTEVELSKPHSSWERMMCFAVTVKDRQGRNITTDTHSIFYTHGLTEPLLEEYINKKVLVAYNNTTEYVVVIG